MTDAPTITDGSVVTMHYKLVLDGGQVVDSSEGREPLGYLHGAGNILPGLEEAMTGKAVGETFDVRVEPDQGYGVRHTEAIQRVPRAAFPPDAALQPGLQFQAMGPDQRPLMGTINEVGLEEITVDFNHPLAGETLHCTIEVVSIRDATAEEKEHGHVHTGSEHGAPGH